MSKTGYIRRFNEIGIGDVPLVEGAPHPLDVAVRSSATAEDLPDASFAGQTGRGRLTMKFFFFPAGGM